MEEINYNIEVWWKGRIKILSFCVTHWEQTDFLDKAMDTGGFLNFGIQLHELVQRLLVSVLTANYLPSPGNQKRIVLILLSGLSLLWKINPTAYISPVKWCNIIST